MLRRSSLPAAVVALAILAAGCNQPWHQAARGLASAQAVNDAAHEVLEGIREDVVAEEQAGVEESYREVCPEPSPDCPDIEPWMDQWRLRIGSFRTAVDAVRTIDDAIIEGSEAVAVWQRTRTDDVPDTLRATCTTLGSLMPQVLEALRRFEVDYPDELDGVASILGPVCAWTVDFIESLVGGAE
jgi:hypothetical protein